MNDCKDCAHRKSGHRLRIARGGYTDCRLLDGSERGDTWRSVITFMDGDSDDCAAHHRHKRNANQQ